VELTDHARLRDNPDDGDRDTSSRDAVVTGNGERPAANLSASTDVRPMSGAGLTNPRREPTSTTSSAVARHVLSTDLGTSDAVSATDVEPGYIIGDVISNGATFPARADTHRVPLSTIDGSGGSDVLLGCPTLATS